MQGQGYAWTPGIHSREQMEAWHRVTKAVHEARGLIFNQLWHVGRISHPALQPDNMLPVAPSPVIPEGKAFIENDRGEGARGYRLFDAGSRQIRRPKTLHRIAKACH